MAKVRTWVVAVTVPKDRAVLVGQAAPATRYQRRVLTEFSQLVTADLLVRPVDVKAARAPAVVRKVANAAAVRTAVA